MVIGQADSVWMTTQGGLGIDEWNEVVLCDNGDLVMIGTTSSDLNAGNEIYIARVDSLHQCVWTKTIGEWGVEKGQDIIVDSAGTFWCLGTVNGASTDDYDGLLLHISADGEVLGNYSLSWPGFQWGQKLAYDGAQTLGISLTTVNNGGGNDWIFCRFNISTFEWESSQFSVLQPSLEITVTEWDSVNVQWFVAGNAEGVGGLSQVMGWGIDIVGMEVWNNADDLNCFSLRVFDALWKNGYWILAGSDFFSGNWRAQIIRWMPGQAMEWMGSFAATDGETLFHSIEHRSTGNGYVLGGWTYAMGAGLSDAYIHAFDDNFNWDGGAIFGGSKEDKIQTLIHDHQGRLHWVGSNGSYHTSMQLQGWLARFNSGYVQSSNITTMIENSSCFALEVTESNLEEQPDFVQMSDEIVFTDWMEEIIIWDMLGHQVQTTRLSNRCDIRLSPGCYIVQFKNKHASGSRLVMVQGS